MKYCCLILVILFFYFPGRAKDNYTAYHKEIIRCEAMFLYGNDIPAALKAYKEVFDRYDKPFAKDCFTALQLAAYIKDRGLSEYFMAKAFGNGVDTAAIRRSVWASRLLSEDPAFESKVVTLYGNLHARYGRSIDSTLRARIIAMKNRDDSFKMLMQGLMPNAPGYAERKSAYRTVLNEQAQELVRLTQKHGYPGDRMIGFMDYGFDSGEQRIEHCYTLRSLTDQLFYHQSCCFLMLEEEMKQALHDGLVSPSMYALYYDWAYQHLKTGHEDIALCGAQAGTPVACYSMPTAFKPWEMHTDTAYVNKCRAEIGLASLQHTKLKEVFAKEHSMQLFFGMFRAY